MRLVDAAAAQRRFDLTSQGLRKGRTLQTASVAARVLPAELIEGARADHSDGPTGKRNPHIIDLIEEVGLHHFPKRVRRTDTQGLHCPSQLLHIVDRLIAARARMKVILHRAMFLTTQLSGSQRVDARQC